MIDINRKSPELGLSPFARGNPKKNVYGFEWWGPIPVRTGEPPHPP